MLFMILSWNCRSTHDPSLNIRPISTTLTKQHKSGAAERGEYQIYYVLPVEISCLPKGTSIYHVDKKILNGHNDC